MSIAIEGTHGRVSSSARAVVTRLPGIATAATASIGAGAIHAGAIGIHAEHAALTRLFILSAVFQLGWGMAALVRPSRWLAAIGAAGNLVFVGAWLITRLRGVSFIEGLEVRESAQFTDTASAALGLIAAGLAVAATLIGWRRAERARLMFPSLAVAALTIPAMIAGANHVHSEGAAGHTHATGTAAVDESQPHDHGTATPAGSDGSGGGSGVVVPAVIDESQPHDHGTAAAVDTTAASDGTADPTASTVVESQPHTHPTQAVAPVPYDPTKPIDLGGVPGVTPEQQARAENLVAINVVRLPQWSDPKVAEAAGFHSIGDGITGFEHYIQWDWINDDDYLDPDHPESLVYSPQPDGSKQLVSAMFMLPDTVPLTDVPDIGGALTQWHIHDNLCFTTDPVAPRVAGLTNSAGECNAPLQKFRSAPMIHVWITPNKCGPFSALEGVGAGQIADGQERLCDEAHGTGGLLGI
jgi:hypothetical protein